jgi:hypothetical protein
MTEEEGKRETRIGEVGHLFLSGQEAREIPRRGEAPGDIPSREARGIFVLAVVCPRAAVSRTIFTVDLAAEFSMRGNRTAILPQVSLAPNAITLLGLGEVELFPRGSGMRLIEGPFGISLILMEGEPDTPSKQIRPRTISALEEMTQRARILLLELPESITRKDAPLLALADELILLVPPDPDLMTEAFRQLMAVTDIAPKPGAWIVASDVDEERDGQKIYREMDDLSQDFLGRRLEYLGYVCKDPRHFMISLEDPAALTRGKFSRLRKCMHEIAGLLCLGEDFSFRTSGPRPPLSRRL